MTDQLYDIVFYGNILPGNDLAAVKNNLSRLLKIDIERTENLFKGNRAALKRNVDEATAKKYQSVLSQAGADIRIEPVDQPSPIEKPAPAEKPATAAPVENTPALKEKAPANISGNENSIGISEPGERLIPEKEKVAAYEPDISGFSVSDVGADVTDGYEKPVPLNIDVSKMDMSEVGADVTDGYEKPAPIEIDLSALAMSEAGSDVTDGYEKPAPLNIDISKMDMSEVGANVSDTIEKPKPYIPNLEGMSLAENKDSEKK